MMVKTERKWYGAYVTVNNSTFLLAVENNPQALKKKFAEWYADVSGYDGGVRITIKEVSIMEKY